MVVAVHRVPESVGELGTVDSRAVVDVTSERSMFLLRPDTCMGDSALLKPSFMKWKFELGWHRLLLDSVNDTDAAVLGRLVQAGAYPGGGGQLTLLSEQVGVDDLLVVLMGNLSSTALSTECMNQTHVPAAG
jgi:hypothetical protein